MPVTTVLPRLFGLQYFQPGSDGRFRRQKKDEILHLFGIPANVLFFAGIVFCAMLGYWFFQR